MGKRIILSQEEMKIMRGDNYLEKSKEGVKEGSPVDDMTDISNPDSILSKYLKRKIEEYDLAMENFEEDLEDKLEKAHNTRMGIVDEEDDSEEETTIGGYGSYKTDDDIDSEEDDSKIIKFERKSENINPNNIIDDLL